MCEAIQHAHQKGVIHRKIKASNGLIREHDGRAEPKVIDFGIAKATATGLNAEATVTNPGQLTGTPSKMSPEQAIRELRQSDCGGTGDQGHAGGTSRRRNIAANPAVRIISRRSIARATRKNLFGGER